MTRFHIRQRLRQLAGDAIKAWPSRLRGRVRGYGNRSVEALHHYRCPRCHKWFSIADAPWERDEWYCPWCGVEGRYNSMN